MAARRKSALAKAKYQMAPSRVFWRFASGGKHNSFEGVVKSTLGIGKSTAVSRMTPENHARLVAGKRPNLKTAAQSSAKPAAKKPAQSRGAAAKKAASTGAKKTAAQRTKRKADGTFNGSAPALSALDQRDYERRRNGALTDDAQMRRLFGGQPTPIASTRRRNGRTG